MPLSCRPIHVPLSRTLTLCAAIGMVMSVSEANAADQPLNFVVIMADDLGYGDLSCYGNRAYATPALDRMAKEGLRFTDFHSSGAVCSPTRAGLLTGRYQQRAGVDGVIYAAAERNRHHGLMPGELTFAEVLKRAGYHTGCFGKWHLGYRPKFNPTHQGFDEFRGYVSGNVDYISHIDGTGIFDWWNDLKLKDDEGYSTHLITEYSLDFIRRHHEHPFCLYVAHESPHYPYQKPDSKPVRAVGDAKLRRETPAEIQEAYSVMIQEMDRGVGEILKLLQELDIADETVVLFFSDNGGTPKGSNGTLRGHKGSLWEGGHRVPCIAWSPSRIDAGTTNVPCMTIDVMPTLLDLANVPLDDQAAPLDGKSLTDVLAGRTGSGKPRDLFWDYRGQLAMRRGPWKYLSSQRGKARNEYLFNLADDIGERKNLADSRPDLLRTMRERAQAWRQDVMSDATPQPDRP